MASLGLNFVAKIPGVAAVFVILPLVSRSLGTQSYGELLSALAIGSAFTLPFGGINTVGRRLMASAFGAKDKKKQADAFVTTMTVMAIVAIVCSMVMISATAKSWSAPIFILISALPDNQQFL